MKDFSERAWLDLLKVEFVALEEDPQILKKRRSHSYHIQLQREVLYTDFEKRVRIGNSSKQNFFINFLWWNGSIFHKNRFVNQHNYHYYSTKNPHLLRHVDNQHRWSINVWAGIIGEGVTAIHFFKNEAMFLNLNKVC